LTDKPANLAAGQIADGVDLIVFTGGRAGTSPKKQNTQQSPGFGFIRAPQPRQSQKTRQS
jgi:hypothetical protein